MIRGYDQAHRLFRGRRTDSYIQMTASDIATKVAQRAGLKVGEVNSTRTVFPHLSQAGQTDWELLELLARDNGFEVAVRDGSFSFTAAGHGGQTRPTARSGPARQPVGARAGQGPAALPLGADLGRSRSARSRSAAGTWPPSRR